MVLFIPYAALKYELNIYVELHLCEYQLCLD